MALGEGDGEGDGDRVNPQLVPDIPYAAISGNIFELLKVERHQRLQLLAVTRSECRRGFLVWRLESWRTSDGSGRRGHDVW